MKVYSKCGIPKDESEFNKEKKNEDGLQGQCRKCLNERIKLWRDKEKEIVNAKRRLKHNASPSVQANYENKYRVSGGRKRIYDNNRDEFLDIAKRWRERNPDKIRSKNKSYRILNAEKLSSILKKQVETLDDKYVMRVIRASMDWLVAAKDVPKDLIDIYRTKIIIHRKLKQHDNNS